MRIRKRVLVAALFISLSLLSGATSAVDQIHGAAVVKAVCGSAASCNESGVDCTLRVGSIVQEGHTIRTGHGSSVDLLLGANGPGIALEEDSVLRFDQLSSHSSALGAIIDTRLDLRQGRLYGAVEKLRPGSRYEIKTPRGVAAVRGTEFLIDARSGSVFVAAGTVNVTLVLEDANGGALTRTISVAAGQQLVVPHHFADAAAFYQLTAVGMPPGLNKKVLERLHGLGMLTGYSSSHANSSVVETFNTATKKSGAIQVEKPPSSVVVSP